MSIQQQIISAAERTFDHHGFTASGMDRLTDAAGVSSRTLYKRVGNKNSLMAAALANRRERFFRFLDASSIDALFAQLKDWSEAEGARGCLFLRALADTGGSVAEVTSEVAAYRQNLRDFIASMVIKETGTDVATDGILVLFEGAVTTASYRGRDAIQAARTTAAVLLERSHQQDEEPR